MDRDRLSDASCKQQLCVLVDAIYQREQSTEFHINEP